MTSAATSTGILAASILGPAVRYLRMLSNCVAAAVLATAYVLALVVELNPALPLWRNVAASSLVLDPATASTIVRSGYALAAAAACCFIVAVLHRGRPRARAAWVSMFLLIAAASVATPMALRGRGTPPPLEARPIDAPLTASEAERSARVVVIAIDGGSLDFITSATAEGRLPNFGRLRSEERRVGKGW